ncbi:uncharacterized protein LOC125619209 [Marmota marmota marmota]|uniref:uncharacterized protein LOC125619209 n=1 Tax=Marmota marmota marmota TaxID=9994 RepID=UPI002092AEF6|nr:uncharacterized protein LOC125619209 [Marmota marmota marmota]
MTAASLAVVTLPCFLMIIFQLTQIRVERSPGAAGHVHGHSQLTSGLRPPAWSFLSLIQSHTVLPREPQAVPTRCCGAHTGRDLATPGSAAPLYLANKDQETQAAWPGHHQASGQGWMPGRPGQRPLGTGGRGLVQAAVTACVDTPLTESVLGAWTVPSVVPPTRAGRAWPGPLLQQIPPPNQEHRVPGKVREGDGDVGGARFQFQKRNSDLLPAVKPVSGHLHGLGSPGPCLPRLRAVSHHGGGAGGSKKVKDGTCQVKAGSKATHHLHPLFLLATAPRKCPVPLSCVKSLRGGALRWFCRSGHSPRGSSLWPLELDSWSWDQVCQGGLRHLGRPSTSGSGPPFSGSSCQGPCEEGAWSRSPLERPAPVRRAGCAGDGWEGASASRGGHSPAPEDSARGGGGYGGGWTEKQLSGTRHVPKVCPHPKQIPSSEKAANPNKCGPKSIVSRDIEAAENRLEEGTRCSPRPGLGGALLIPSG